jgi:hypothetical protein
MRPFSNRASGLFLFISLFIMGLWLQPAYARGDLNSGWRSSAPHISTHRSHIGPRLPGRGGIHSRSRGSHLRHQKFHFRRGTSGLKNRFKNRSFRNRLYLFQAPFLYTPDTPDPSNLIIEVPPEEREPSEAQPEESPKPYKSSHPLIIEERCGVFVKIPWPESGRLYEEDQPEQCPESD